MKRFLFSYLLLLVAPMVGTAQPYLSMSSFSGAAIEVEHATLRLTAILGQPFVGRAITTDYTLEVGFWFGTNVPQATPVEPAVGIPTEIYLGPNYPNPFNPQTTISYAIPHSEWVRLAVYDALGREVVRLVDQQQAAGGYLVSFEAGSLSSGAYFYRLEVGATVRVGTMLLFK